MRSVITPLIYIWVNNDTRGCVKSPEKPKEGCGHLVPPKEFTWIPIPGSDRVKYVLKILEPDLHPQNTYVILECRLDYIWIVYHIQSKLPERKFIVLDLKFEDK